MTRDEVVRGDPERGRNVEIVTRWRDRQGVKSMAPIELAALGNVLWDAADYERERALKSKPPEKSPEVGTETNPFESFTWFELADVAFDLTHQLRDAHMVARSAEAESQTRIEGLEAERDHYRQAAANLRTLHDSAVKGIVELATKLEAALARIKALEWERDGAPMAGEPRNLTPEEQAEYNASLATLMVKP